MVTPQEEGVDVAWQKEMVDKAEPKVIIIAEILSIRGDCCCGEIQLLGVAPAVSDGFRLVRLVKFVRMYQFGRAR